MLIATCSGEAETNRNCYVLELTLSTTSEITVEEMKRLATN